MKNTFGTSVSVTIFGESHGNSIGAVLDGIAPGIPVDEEYIAHQMSLRKAVGKISTPRREADAVKIVSGVFNGKTTYLPFVKILVVLWMRMTMNEIANVYHLRCVVRKSYLYR